MIFKPVAQRSDEWFKDRLGHPNSSQYHRIITPGGKPSTSAPLYMAELVAERIFERPMHEDISNRPAPRYGIDHEDEAAAWLKDLLGDELLPGGYAMDDEARYGCSPDRMIVSGNRKEVVEIKCPYLIPNHIRNLLFGPEDSHKAQVQGQLLITGCNAAHFVSYRHDCPPYHTRIEPDPAFLAALKTLLDKFCAELEVQYLRAKDMGAWQT